MDDVKFPVDELLGRWASSWLAADIDTLVGEWDETYDDRSYLATERDEAVSSMDDIREYFGMLNRWQPERWDVTDVVVAPLADGVMSVRCKMRMVYRLPAFEQTEPSVWRGRCWMIWRRRADGAWKLLHQEDSTNEFDRAVNILRRVADGQTRDDLEPVRIGWEKFVPAAG